ncbi:MAG: hypothetical protein ACI9NQ_001313 [Paracoccaceae bacterium]|jgi:hypothetical protein
MKHLSFLPLLLIASCGSLKKDDDKDDDKDKITGPEKKIIGRIASVSRAGEFVLIQKFGPGALPKNTIYQSQGPEGRTASLRPSGERVRDFYAADLVSGNVEKDDAVVGYPNLAKKKEQEPDLTDSEEKKEITPSLPAKKMSDKLDDKEPQTIGLPD